jgi:serine phosphatase RsbU (regulator of sigma subunit)
MNRELEEKVRERTREVVMQKEEIEAQKEEIEAQKEEIEAQLDLTTDQRDTISRQKELILDSIRYAERIQSALLPPELFLSESVSDYFILFRPRDIVSGDFYWTSFREGKLLVAAADCTGHGVPGAFLSLLGISSMNEIVNRIGSVKASHILEQLRDFVIASLHQTGTSGETQDGIEVGICVIDPVSLTLEFAGANRPLYLVRGGENGDETVPQDYRVIQYRGDRMPIGIYEQEPIPFTDHQVHLKKNDALYLFSDGYMDQLGGPKRKTFRTRRFRKLLLEICELSMEEQKKVLQERLDKWQGDVEQIDDILVIGIRI